MVIPNIVDSSLFSYTLRPKPNESTIIFTCVAHWEFPKRLDLIVESLKIFALSLNKTLILNVIGNGSQCEIYRNSVFTNVTIHWCGHLPKSKISELLVNTNFFVHASNIETFSIVIAEALTMGTPVLASKVGAIPELINPKNGILVENNVDDWVAGLCEITKRLYNNKQIAEQIQWKFTKDTISTQLHDVYHTAMHKVKCRFR
jgi:L-malate glycosyltransferase